MKRTLLLSAILLVMMFLNACAETNHSDVAAIIRDAAAQIEPVAEKTNLKLGVVPGPYGDMFLDAIQPFLAQKGYTMELVFYDDFVKPNIALGNYEVELNMFQHYRYLNNFKLEHDLDLSAIAEIPTISMGVYSSGYITLEDIEDGAVVAIPDDATNMARALRVLEAAGVISINPHIDKNFATTADLGRNPRNLVFDALPANQLVGTLSQYGLAVINGNFAYAGGLNSADTLYNEILSDGFVNVIAVRTEDLGRNFVSDILAVIHSDDFKDAIFNSKYSGFQRPIYFMQ
jgi:D-methionine transport system substrate-binding protein